MFEIAQTMQVLDIVFSLVGVTRNSVATAGPQIFSRLLIAHVVFPLVPEGHWAVFLCILTWSLAEIVRFSFYLIKE